MSENRPNKIINFNPYLKKKNLDKLVEDKKVSFIFPTLYYVVKDGVGKWVTNPEK